MSFLLEIEHFHFDKQCSSFKGMHLPAYIEKREDKSLFIWVGSSMKEGGVFESMSIAYPPSFSTPIIEINEPSLITSKRISSFLNTPVILSLPLHLPPAPNCTMNQEEFYLAIEIALKKYFKR